MTLVQSAVEALMMSAERLPVVIVRTPDGVEVRWAIDDPLWFPPGSLNQAHHLPAVAVVVDETNATYGRVEKLYANDWLSHGRPAYGRVDEHGTGLDESTYGVQLGPGLDGRAHGWAFGLRQLESFVDEALGAAGLTYQPPSMGRGLVSAVTAGVTLICVAVALIVMLL